MPTMSGWCILSIDSRSSTARRRATASLPVDLRLEHHPVVLQRGVLGEVDPAGAALREVAEHAVRSLASPISSPGRSCGRKEYAVPQRGQNPWSGGGPPSYDSPMCRGSCPRRSAGRRPGVRAVTWTTSASGGSGTSGSGPDRRCRGRRGRRARAGRTARRGTGARPEPGSASGPRPGSGHGRGHGVGATAGRAPGTVAEPVSRRVGILPGARWARPVPRATRWPRAAAAVRGGGAASGGRREQVSQKPVAMTAPGSPAAGTGRARVLAAARGRVHCHTSPSPVGRPSCPPGRPSPPVDPAGRARRAPRRR